MWGIDHNRFGICSHQMPKLVQVECPIVLLARLPGTNIASGGASDIRQGLITGRMDDNVIVFLERSEHEQEDCLFCAGVNEDVIWLDLLIHLANLRPQRRPSL